VDADRASRELVCTYLEKQGLAACGVAGAQAMRAALQHFVHDLVVVDVATAGGDSLTLCRELRAGRRVRVRRVRLGTTARRLFTRDGVPVPCAAPNTCCGASSSTIRSGC
jgi:CheY-like chemotaxis protein